MRESKRRLLFNNEELRLQTTDYMYYTTTIHPKTLGEFNGLKTR